MVTETLPDLVTPPQAQTMHISSLWLAAASILPTTHAIPFPNPHEPTTNTVTLPLEPRAQDPTSQCKFSLHNINTAKCSGSSPPAGSSLATIALGSDPAKPFRNDPVGQRVGAASPCHNVTSATKSAVNSFWLTDNACADKSRYDVIAVFDSSDCRAAGKRVQFDIAATWARTGGKGFCKKVDFNMRGIQLWQWLPATLPGLLNGTGF